MVDWYSCHKCKRAFALLPGSEKRCSSCGGTNGEIVSQQHVREGVDAGAYFNIDSRTGKRSKKKKPR